MESGHGTRQAVEEQRPLPPEAERFRGILREYLPELRGRHKVRTLWLFGSYVWGEQEPGSDLDVLVDFAQPPTLIELAALEQELGDLLAVKVDLVTRGSLTGRVGRNILAEARIV